MGTDEYEEGRSVKWDRGLGAADRHSRLRENSVNAKSGNWVNTEETGGLTVREWLSSHFLHEFKTEIGLT